MPARLKGVQKCTPKKVFLRIHALLFLFLLCDSLWLYRLPLAFRYYRIHKCKSACLPQFVPVYNYILYKKENRARFTVVSKT